MTTNPHSGGPRATTVTSNPSAQDNEFHPPVTPVLEDSNGWNPPAHNGIDLICNPNSTLYAVCKAEVIDARSSGWWSKGATGDISRGDGVIRLRSLITRGNLKKGMVIGYGHAEHPEVHVGQIVEAGHVIGKAGFANAWHVHFFMGQGDARDGEFDPEPFYRAFMQGQAPTGASTGNAGAGSSATGVIDADVFGISKGAAFAAYFDLPGAMNQAESMMMQGAKSIWNDEPLLPFIEQLTKASARHFQSLPNGAFYAFFPDYFGSYNHRGVYWEIDDVEITDGAMELSDEELKTHVFVVGDTAFTKDNDITLQEKIASKGVYTIFNAFRSAFTVQKESDKNTATDQLQGHAEALTYLQRYGVRPHYEEASFIRNGMFELFYAFTQFQLAWARQFMTKFTFTFMPELYPGGRVRFPSNGIECYIDSVSHHFDYTEGFFTQANLSAPAAAAGNDAPISQGMIKPFEDGLQQLAHTVKK